MSDLGKTETSFSSAHELSGIDEKKWELALIKQKEIQKLVLLRKRKKSDVELAASKIGCSIAWVYELIKRYEKEGTVSSLIPHSPTGGRGKGRISEELEVLIQDVIDEIYLTRQKVKVFHIVRAVKHRCRELNLKPPAENTIRSRIKDVPSRKAMKARESGHLARDKFDPIVGEFPKPKWPLGVIQMDHTKTDIIVVDEENRKPIGRAYCTAAIDLYSRAILGFHISLEAPSAITIGLCLVHAVLPKKKWLNERGIEAEWPMWGKPDVLHVDNGPDFRSEALKKGCEEHGIVLQHRPVRHPRFGGTVERIFRTIGQEIHSFPGSTFSNTAERGLYDSDKFAALTLSELERILVLFITGQYHEKKHSSLLMSPKKAYEVGIYGNEDELGRGLPIQIQNERKFLIDFLPLQKRSIQRYGIVWDHICYYDDCLKPLIDKEDKRRFIVRRDPRDISRIFLYLSETSEYIELPYRNISRPSISLWEANAARERLKKFGEEYLDEDKIFETHEKIQSELQRAKFKTKSMRRKTERKKMNQLSLNRTPVKEECLVSEKIALKAEIEDCEIDFDEKFDEIEHW